MSDKAFPEGFVTYRPACRKMYKVLRGFDTRKPKATLATAHAAIDAREAMRLTRRSAQVFADAMRKAGIKV